MARRPQNSPPTQQVPVHAAAHAGHAHGHDHSHVPGEPHIVPVKTYVLVFTSLMVLLVATLVAAAFDLGSVNLPVAMAIAIAKAVIIMTFFMHLKWSSVMVRFFATFAFFWLAVLFLLTMSDYVARDWHTAPRIPLIGEARDPNPYEAAPPSRPAGQAPAAAPGGGSGH